MDDEIVLRPATDTDSGGLILLLGSVFAEYENCILDVDDEMPELLRPASHFARMGGELWVAQHLGGIAGSFAWAPRTVSGSLEFELFKVYVHRRMRGTGIAWRLYQLALRRAREAGAVALTLWTDTRFEAGHRFYERQGFLRQPQTRELHDRSDTVEYHYRLELVAR